MSETPKYQNTFNFHQAVGNVNAGDTTIAGDQVGLSTTTHQVKISQKLQRKFRNYWFNWIRLILIRLSKRSKRLLFTKLSKILSAIQL